MLNYIHFDCIYFTRNKILVSFILKKIENFEENILYILFYK